MYPVATEEVIPQSVPCGVVVHFTSGVCLCEGKDGRLDVVEHGGYYVFVVE